MKHLNYETLLTLHYLLKDTFSTQMGSIHLMKATCEYFQLTTEEIYRRIDEGELGVARYEHFPWGSQEKYVDYEAMEAILDSIRHTREHKKAQGVIDEQMASDSDSGFDCDTAIIRKHVVS